MELSSVRIDKPEDAQVILGQAHFVKTVEDVHEALAGSSPHLRFGLAFCEASGVRLVRRSGNDAELVEAATRAALAVGAGHCFVVLLREGFPLNVPQPAETRTGGLPALLRHHERPRGSRRRDGPRPRRHRRGRRRTAARRRDSRGRPRAPRAAALDRLQALKAQGPSGVTHRPIHQDDCDRPAGRSARATRYASGRAVVVKRLPGAVRSDVRTRLGIRCVDHQHIATRRAHDATADRAVKLGHASTMTRNDDHVRPDTLRSRENLARSVTHRRRRLCLDPTLGHEPPCFVEQARLPAALLARRLDPSAHTRLRHHVHNRHGVPGAGELGSMSERPLRWRRAIIRHEHPFHPHALSSRRNPILRRIRRAGV